MVVKDGRFGPYVTDGETNASLRKGDEVASITIERAAELLADRRAAAPSPRRAGRAAPKKARRPRAPRQEGGDRPQPRRRPPPVRTPKVLKPSRNYNHDQGLTRMRPALPIALTP